MNRAAEMHTTPCGVCEGCVAGTDCLAQPRREAFAELVKREKAVLDLLKPGDERGSEYTDV